MTIKKKIAAIAAAAAMALSMTAISASATYDCTLDHLNDVHELNGNTVFGVVAGGERGANVYGVLVDKNLFSATYYAGTASYIRTTLEIVKYPTGGTLDTFEDIQRNTTSVPSIAKTGTNGSYGSVTLFSSHEVRADGKTWGEYTAVKGVE